MNTVTVVIPSLGRPSLRKTLVSLAEQVLPEGMLLDAIVADDSGNGAARAIVETSAPGLRVVVVDAGARNISLARNRAIALASGDFIAFIDDDEWAEKHWLAELWAASNRFGADVVFGAVKPVYPAEAPAWAARADLYRKDPGPDGARQETGATCNALVRRQYLSATSFNEAFGETGGEDTELFFRLGREGAIMIASERALVYENVPLERLRLRHLALRYARGGYTYAQLTTGNATIFRSLTFYGDAMVKMVLSGVAAGLSYFVRPHVGVTMALKATSNAGKLWYGLGRPSPRPY